MYETFYYSNAPINAKDCSISNPSWLEKHQGGSWSRRPWLSCHGQSVSWGIILPYVALMKRHPQNMEAMTLLPLSMRLEGLSCHMLPPWKEGKGPGQPQNIFVTLDCCGLSWKLECARSRFPSRTHNLKQTSRRILVSALRNNSGKPHKGPIFWLEKEPPPSFWES